MRGASVSGDLPTARGPSSSGADSTAVLVIRAWREGEGRRDLRARITSTLDTVSGEEVSSAAAHPDEICAAVLAWLDAFLDGR